MDRKVKPKHLSDALIRKLNTACGEAQIKRALGGCEVDDCDPYECIGWCDPVWNKVMGVNDADRTRTEAGV